MIKVRLGEILSEKGLTIERVAADTGLERGMLTKLAAGRTSIGLFTLDKLCEYLDIEPGDLFHRVPGEGGSEIS